MAPMSETLADFIDEPSWTIRAKIVEGVATLYVDDRLSARQRQDAVELFRVAVLDGEPLVRRVLAESLKHASELPRDVVAALSHDIAEVAAPFLAASPLVKADGALQ